jgi:hypothetical protein
LTPPDVPLMDTGGFFLPSLCPRHPQVANITPKT